MPSVNRVSYSEKPSDKLPIFLFAIAAATIRRWLRNRVSYNCYQIPCLRGPRLYRFVTSAIQSDAGLPFCSVEGNCSSSLCLDTIGRGKARFRTREISYINPLCLVYFGNVSLAPALDPFPSLDRKLFRLESSKWKPVSLLDTMNQQTIWNYNAR